MLPRSTHGEGRVSLMGKPNHQAPSLPSFILLL